MSNKIIFQPSTTTHWRNLFKNKSMLLGAHNLNEGEELVCEMVSVGIQQIKDKNGKNEEVPVLTFTNAPPMVLNITNTTTIAELYGSDYKKWQGQKIQVYATNVKAFGKTSEALRIRPKKITSEDLSQYENALKNCKSLDELKSVFMGLPKHVMPKLSKLKDIKKGELCES